MAVLRAQLDAVLVRRCGKGLAAIGLDGTTVDGTNLDLSDPVREGLGSLGLYPADPTAVADTDLAAVTPQQVPQLLDVAELRALDNLLGNWTEPDQKMGTDQQDLGTLFDSLEGRLARLADRCRRLYGYGLRPLSGGMVDLDFAQTDTDPTPLPPGW